MTASRPFPATASLACSRARRDGVLGRVENDDSPSWKWRLALGRWGGVSGPWVVAARRPGRGRGGAGRRQGRGPAPARGARHSGARRLRGHDGRVRRRGRRAGGHRGAAAGAARGRAGGRRRGGRRAGSRRPHRRRPDRGRAGRRARPRRRPRGLPRAGRARLARRPDGRGERRGDWRCRQRRGGRRCGVGRRATRRSPCGPRPPPKTPPTPRTRANTTPTSTSSAPTRWPTPWWPAGRASTPPARSPTAADGLRGAMAVVVQRMVAARAAGVFMTLNPANGDRATFVCEAVWGLGEPLVSGTVTPDRFAVNKISGEVVRREIAHKPTRLGSSGDRARPRRRAGRSPASPTTSWPNCCASAGPSRPRRVHRRTASSPSTTTASTCCKPVRRRSGRSAPAPSPAAAPRSKPCSPP